MKLARWMIGRFISFLFIIVLCCASHDVGQVRAGGNSLALPAFCSFVWGIFVDEDEPVAQEQRPQTLEETDDAGLISEYAKRRLLPRRPTQLSTRPAAQ